VTPSTSGALRPACRAVLLGGFFQAARIISSAPLVWMVNICTSNRTAEADRLGDRVWDVVKFQVEEDAGTSVAHAFDDVRASGSEEFAANFEGSNGRGQLARQFKGLFPPWEHPAPQ